MKILYIDLNNSGLSGDMFLASLLGLVSDPDKILKEIIEIKDFLSGVSKLNIKLIQVPRTGLQLNQLKSPHPGHLCHSQKRPSRRIRRIPARRR